MIKVNEIKKGDIVIYRSGRINIVNNPGHYHYYFNNNFENISKGPDFDILEIKRYVKLLCFYRLATVYRRRLV